MAVMLGIGMWGILVLNTMIQDQSASLVKMQIQARGLSYHEAALSTEVEKLRSSTNLAEQATELGMVPNPHPAFINVETGEITGAPYRVVGNELPNQKYSPLIVPAKPTKAPAEEAHAADGESEAGDAEATDGESATGDAVATDAGDAASAAPAETDPSASTEAVPEGENR